MSTVLHVLSVLCETIFKLKTKPHLKHEDHTCVLVFSIYMNEQKNLFDKFQPNLETLSCEC